MSWSHVSTPKSLCKSNHSYLSSLACIFFLYPLLIFDQPLPLQSLSPQPRDSSRNPEIPLEIALFQEHPFNFHDDFTTGVWYRNPFDVMVDIVVSAVVVAGYETVSIIVTETGWPSSSAAANEFDANLGYLESK